VGYSQAKRDLCLFLDPDLASADAWGWDDDSVFAAALARLTTDAPWRAEAIAAWNTRTPDPSTEALTKRLTAMGEQADKDMAFIGDYIIANGNLLAERDALEAKLAECLERNALLEARLAKAVEGLRFYTCTDDGCDGCPEQGRDRVGCGWTARATLAEIEGEQP
jgi:hypothetical protein